MIDLIIVTYNSANCIRGCIEAIQAYTPVPYTIFIVDNGSTDGTIEYVQGLHEVRLIENGQNFGYAYAANRGMASGTSATIAIMNPDVCVTSGWLHPLYELLWSNEKHAIVAPKMINSANQLVGVGTNWDWTAPYFMYPNDPDVLQDTRACLAINGACFIIKRKLLGVLGFLDEYYFHYFEETDYCFQANYSGYTVLYCPASVVYHEYYPNPERDKAIHQYWEQSEAHFNSKWGYLGYGKIIRKG
ncbi:glycosyltransferase family 2 protein [Paenibacillus elgii]|uniref:glycosyltransferase family 2 protein n=1 Tax=Paenibacillus elgii TaxID=189691 RepID=UPI00203C3E7B|nr:glycosyltransferase family 2 protein [Paenibacillus elgii]MCM3270691.1 glycosyltransferase family 2 protein [Paenibacillus elgii]